ncbi:hypothetical protein [Arcanobacterium phocae]|uniref:hypothetical protein n=1 Tax=Arcanobacterium phocae TaxID=131112 RepID=UPI001C0FF292|nr:hypothetical protein [Arcanobacterium phocae]
MTFKKYATHSVLSLMIAGTALVHPYGTAFAATPAGPSAQCTQAQADVASHKQALETLKARQSELMKKLEVEKDARAQAEQKLAELEKAAESNKDKIAQTQNAIDRATAKIKQLESMIGQLNKAIDKQTQELEKAKTALAVAQKNLDAIAADRDKTRAEVSKSEEAVKHSKSEVAAAEKALQKEEEAYNKAVEDRDHRLAQSKAKLEKATGNLQSAEDQLSKINENLDQAKADKKKAEDGLSSSQKRSVKKIEEFNSLKKEMNSYVGLKQHHMNEKDDLEKEITRLNQKIIEVQTKLKAYPSKSELTEKLNANDLGKVSMQLEVAQKKKYELKNSLSSNEAGRKDLERLAEKKLRESAEASVIVDKSIAGSLQELINQNADIKQQHLRLENEKKKLGEEIQENEETILKLTKEKNKLEALRINILAELNIVEEIQRQLDKFEAEKQQAKNTSESLDENIGTLQNDIERVQEGLIKAQKEIRILSDGVRADEQTLKRLSAILH